MKSEFMKFKLLLSVLLVLLNSFASAQTMQDVNPNPRYRIALNTVDGSSMKGLLIGIEDSAIILFPGALKQWKSNAEVKTMEIGYMQIRKIYLKEKRIIAGYAHWHRSRADTTFSSNSLRRK